MRHRPSRATASPLCWWVPTGDGRRVPEHEVVADERGFFRVRSARSGEEYRVSVEGRCTCTGYAERGRCSHLDAVVAHARLVLGR